jgi:exodeoxyribonuclease V beta subunit
MEEQLERLRLRLLRKMAEETVVQLREKKRARRVIGFDDILYNAWDALCNGSRPWLAAELRSRYPAALIDEFQDTDPLQCAIFMKIYDTKEAPGLLFLVGDPKQAIYSFRNADLHTYLGAKQRARKASTLLANQRSVEGLLQATNALFAANPGSFIMDGIRHSAVEPGDKKRAPFTDRSEKSVAPLRIWRLPAKDNGEYLSRNEAHELAVKATAAEISRLLREGAAGRITLEGRDLRGGDIAVLVRTHRQGRWIKEALAALGVGSVELSPESIFATRDAEDLARVLAAILEPAHRPRLQAALATEFIGLGASEVEALSQDDASLAEWTARLDELRTTWLARGFGVMFRRWDRRGRGQPPPARARRRRAAHDEPAASRRAAASHDGGAARAGRSAALARHATRRSWKRRGSAGAARIGSQPRPDRHDSQGERPRIPDRVLPIRVGRLPAGPQRALCNRVPRRDGQRSDRFLPRCFGRRTNQAAPPRGACR